MASWTVYILKCGDGSLYTGITNDLEKRIEKHNAGTGAKYTRSRLPVRLAWSESVESESAAKVREAQIKRLPRNKKLSLVKAAP